MSNWAFIGGGGAPRSWLQDGVNESVQVADSPAFSFGNGTIDFPFSISVWSLVTDFTNTGVANFGIFVKDGLTEREYFLSYAFGGGGTIRFAILSNSGSFRKQKTTNTAFSATNVWRHIVGTYDGSMTIGGLTLYVNESAQATTDVNDAGYTAMTPGSEPLLLGKAAAENARMPGNLCEIALYNMALSSADVTALYNSGKPVDARTVQGANLVSYWPVTSRDDLTIASGVIDVIGSRNGSGQNMEAGDLVTTRP